MAWQLVEKVKPLRDLDYSHTNSMRPMMNSLMILVECPLSNWCLILNCYYRDDSEGLLTLTNSLLKTVNLSLVMNLSGLLTRPILASVPILSKGQWIISS